MSVDTPPKKMALEQAAILLLKTSSPPLPLLAAPDPIQPLNKDAMSGRPHSINAMSLPQKNHTVMSSFNNEEGMRTLPLPPHNSPITHPIELAYIVTTLSGEIQSEEKEKNAHENNFLDWVKPISLYLGSLSLLSLGTYYALKPDEKKDVTSKVTAVTNDVISGPVVKGRIDTNTTTPAKKYSTLTLDEDKVHVFSLEDFDTSIGEATSIQVTRLPIDGYLRFDGDLIAQPPFTVAINDLDRLTFKGRANANGEDYASLRLNTMKGASPISEYRLEFAINPVNDQPVIDVAPVVMQPLSAPWIVDSNIHSFSLTQTDTQHALMTWVDENKLFLQQATVQNAKLVTKGEPLLIDAKAADTQVVIDPMIVVNGLGQAVLSWMRYSDSEGTSAFMQWFDQSMTPLSDISVLGDTLYPQSLISLNNGYTALGYASSGTDAGFAINLYDQDFTLTNVIEVADTYMWGANQMILSPLLSGGFLAAFKSVNGEIKQNGFSAYNEKGDWVTSFEGVPDALLTQAANVVMLSTDTDKTIFVHQLSTHLHVQIHEKNGALQPSQIINASVQGEVTDWQAIKTTNDDVFIAWVQDHDAQTSLWGRFYSSKGDPLSDATSLKAWTDLRAVEDLQLQCSESDIHLTWREENDNGDSTLLATLDTKLFQHAVEDGLSVARVAVTDQDSSIISLTLAGDNATYFQIDSTGLIRVQDAAAINDAAERDFALQIIAEDDGGEQAVFDYLVSFPVTQSMTLNEETLYILSLDGMGTEDASGIESFTVAQLLDKGLLTPANETDLYAPAVNTEIALAELYAQSEYSMTYLQNDIIG